MKNLVKKTRKKSWLILVPGFIISTIVCYCVFLAFFAWLAMGLDANSIEKQKLFSMMPMLYIIAIGYGTMITVYIGNKIWKKVDRQIISNKECRNIHHTNLLKKYILLNDKKASTTLLNQYKNAKYKNNNAYYYYFCGAYQRQFDNLNYSPLMLF
jgi:hypothetical protein